MVVAHLSSCCFFTVSMQCLRVGFSSSSRKWGMTWIGALAQRRAGKLLTCCLRNCNWAWTYSIECSRGRHTKPTRQKWYSSLNLTCWSNRSGLSRGSQSWQVKDYTKDLWCWCQDEKGGSTHIKMSPTIFALFISRILYITELPKGHCLAASEFAHFITPQVPNKSKIDVCKVQEKSRKNLELVPFLSLSWDFSDSEKIPPLSS